MSSKEKPGMSFEDFKREALKYSPEERAELRDTLSASLEEEDEDDSVLDQHWREEIDRRYREYKEGKAQVYEVEDVLAELRAKLA
jgi:putative addiction module component (TIGR02574 family)